MSEEAEQIRRRMEAVRFELARDVGDAVHSAGRMLDWREYVQRYPWACLGAAAAVGFLLVPRRLEIVSPDAATLLKLANKNKLVVEADPRPRKRGGMVGSLLTLAANAAVRSAVAYLGQRAGRPAGGQVSGAGHGDGHRQPKPRTRGNR